MKELKRLIDYGKIYLVAPSFGCTTEPYKTRLDVAIKNFSELGYQIIEGPNIRLNKGVMSSNTPKLRAKEFMDAYMSDADVIISVGGGELMNEILPFINFEKIKKLPSKTFMGFSDNTNLTYTLTTISEIPTIYGPNFPSFAFLPFSDSTLDALNLLKGTTNVTKGYPYWERYKEKNIDPLCPSNKSEVKIIKTYPKLNEVSIEGRMLGGNLDILSNLVGTKFDKTKEYIEKYKDDGFIWFLEACDLNPLGIRRAIFNLKEAGWFKYAKGFLIGRPLCYKEKIGNVNHYNAPYFTSAYSGMMFNSYC